MIRTISFALFHFTIVVEKGLPWLKPMLEEDTGLGPTEYGLNCGRLTVFLTAGRPARV